MYKLFTGSEHLILDINEGARQHPVDALGAIHALRFSEKMAKEAVTLKRFLRENLYQHYQVNRMTSKARRIVVELFDCFVNEPTLLPPDHRARKRRPSDRKGTRSGD